MVPLWEKLELWDFWEALVHPGLLWCPSAGHGEQLWSLI